MPHIIIKMYPGRSENQKVELASRIVDAVMDILKVDIRSISLGIEEVKPEDWAEEVYIPDILKKGETLYKRPGYRP
ncbi:MAG TPA: tautomerase family protein [Candidatus Atribacteria bacterium]|nr:tautomerase family protein [Candidatus Atribacteria bacterium]HPT78227.1 tautomerase family protein [Candidatus Atribacteria bacterium]